MMAALATDSESVSEVMREWARELFLLRWVRTVRPGADGDFLYRGLGYKNLLDVVSRGLHNLPVGTAWDIRPSHRIAVFDVQEEPTIGSGARVGGTVEAVQIQAVVSQTGACLRATSCAPADIALMRYAFCIRQTSSHSCSTRCRRATWALRCRTAPSSRWAGCAATWLPCPKTCRP